MIRIWICLLALTTSQRTIAQTDFSTGLETLQIGNATIVFRTKCASEQKGIRFIHVHENEQIAAAAADSMLRLYGRGCFTTWQSWGDRYINFMLDSAIYKFDPNRIYSECGRKESLMANGEYSEDADSLVAGIANLFLHDYIDSQRLVIALHNNTDRGGLTIKSYKKGGPYQNDAQKVHINKTRDEDDFFLTTDHDIYKFFKSKGFNVLLQDNEKVSDDGSLSVYAAAKKIPYVNIEAQHGHLKEQLEMIAVVQEMIAALFP